MSSLSQGRGWLAPRVFTSGREPGEGSLPRAKDPALHGEAPAAPGAALKDGATLAAAGGGSAFLSDRRNIVVIADEGHRSHYDFIDGYARFMWDELPHASFIGFTDTPIAKADANTRSVFGDYISVYDSQRAVEDHATVPIYYEGRLANLELDQNEKPEINPELEEVTAGEEVERREKLKSKRPRAHKGSRQTHSP